jgi:hypothetical protein
MKRRISAGLLVASLSIAEEEAGAQTRQYLNSDVTLDCAVNEAAAPAATTVRTYMNAGDTLWVGGFADSTLLPGSWKELANTFLACAPGTTTTITPNTTQIQSRTGINLWDVGTDGTPAARHQTRAIYTAPKAGVQTCWMVYQCIHKNAGHIEFGANSFIQHYAPNQYPGTNWKQEADVSIDSTSSITVENRTWDAGTASRNDSEVVVMWKPHLTNCAACDRQCPADAQGSDNDAYFRWRITVYQYKDGMVCNKNFGAFSADVRCRHHDHHCGVNVYTRAVPIVTGMGTEGDCGSSSSSRKFKVYAQLRKRSEADNDFNAHGGHAYANLSIYSR